MFSINRHRYTFPPTIITKHKSQTKKPNHLNKHANRKYINYNTQTKIYALASVACATQMIHYGVHVPIEQYALRFNVNCQMISVHSVGLIETPYSCVVCSFNIVTVFIILPMWWC